MLLSRVPPEYTTVVECLCQGDRLLASHRSGALRCAQELAAGSLHRQILLFSGVELSDVVQLDECTTHMSFGKVASNPCLAVLTVGRTAVLFAVEEAGRLREAGRWAGVEGVCFCVDAEDQKSACIIQREDKPMCITSLDAASLDGQSPLFKLPASVDASALVGQGAAETCVDMALDAQTHRNEHMMERLHTQEAVLGRALSMLPTLPRGVDACWHSTE